MNTPEPPPVVRVQTFSDLDAWTAYAVWRLRQDVFVIEQDCPYPDLDGRDLEPSTGHLTLVVGDALAGYLRILDDPEAHRIGRVVLARTYRGRGLADLLMRAALEQIGAGPVRLEAQAPLVPWYATFGFTVTGPEYLEDQIAHLPMSRG